MSVETMRIELGQALGEAGVDLLDLRVTAARRVVVEISAGGASLPFDLGPLTLTPSERRERALSAAAMVPRPTSR